MISIVELLSPECIQLDLSGRKKKKAVAELTTLLETAGIVSDGRALAEKIMERETIASTGIGHGIAIPHCLTDMVDHTVMAFGRSSQGIPFDAPDNKPARLIFLLAGPQTATAQHLKLLSKLSRLLTEKNFRRKLLDAAGPQDIITLFQEGEKL